MSLAETASYIAHHVALAGRKDTLFSDDAVARIHESGRGLPSGDQPQPSRPSSVVLTNRALPWSTTRQPARRWQRPSRTECQPTTRARSSPPSLPLATAWLCVVTNGNAVRITKLSVG